MGIKKEKSFPRGGVLRTKSDVSSAPKEKRPAKKEKDLFAVNDVAKVVKKLKKKPNKKVRDKRDQDDDGGLKVKSIGKWRNYSVSALFIHNALIIFL